MNEHQALNEQLANDDGYRPTINEIPQPPSAVALSGKQSAMTMDFAQWQIGANGKYRPGSRTKPTLPPGSYRIDSDDFGLYFEQMRILSDEIMELPDNASGRVLSIIRRFWESRERYHRFGLLYKRGVLLWGPPGSGKTVTLNLLCRELIQTHDGIVLMCDHPDFTVRAINCLRAIEPQRSLIVLIEDIDELINRHSEHSILALLDGEHKTDNVVFLATTNYPERLGARIVNRPSRFDDRIFVGMPSAAARSAYLQRAARQAELPSADLEKWVEETEGLSIAHLRELVAAVFCLEQEYPEVIERLRSMTIQPKPIDGYRQKTLGLNSADGKAAKRETVWG